MTSSTADRSVTPTSAQRQAYYVKYGSYPQTYAQEAVAASMGGYATGTPSAPASTTSSGGGDLMSLIHEAGFTGNAANIMYGIVMAESGGNARSLNNNPGTGDLSYGLAQINMIGSMGPERLKEYGLTSANQLYDPLTNLKVAFKMSGGGTHFGDWSTYNSGAYRQYMGSGYAASVSSAGSGSSGGGGSAGGSSSAMTADDFKQVDSLGNLLTSVPDLNKLVSQAVAGNWSTTKFQNAVENSTWYRSHSDTARAIIIQQANDPAAYGQAAQQARSQVEQLASQLGMKLNYNQVEWIANHALLTGNTSNHGWLAYEIGHSQNYKGVTNLNGMQGGMAQTTQALEQLTQEYGYQWSPAQIAQYAQSILMGATTIDTFKQKQIGWAKSAFPSLAHELDSGQTVKDLSTPYVQSMSSLLEVPPGTLNIFTPAIRKAMQGTIDPATKQRGSTPLWQFEDQLRQDPRWGNTQNAKDTVSTALAKVGADFGFVA